MIRIKKALYTFLAISIVSIISIFFLFMNSIESSLYKHFYPYISKDMGDIVLQAKDLLKEDRVDSMLIYTDRKLANTEYIENIYILKDNKLIFSSNRINYIDSSLIDNSIFIHKLKSKNSNTLNSISNRDQTIMYKSIKSSFQQFSRGKLSSYTVIVEINLHYIDNIIFSGLYENSLYILLIFILFISIPTFILQRWFLAPIFNILQDINRHKVQKESFSFTPFKELHILGNKIIKYQLRIEEQTENLQKYINTVDKNIPTTETDVDGNITYVTEAFSKLSGYSKDELIGEKHTIVKDENSDTELYKDLWKTISSGKVWRGDIKNRKKDGTSFWVYSVISPKFDKHWNIVGYTAVRHDITDKKHLEELSITDGLTGLYNRRHFNSVINGEINRAKRENTHLTLSILDVDFFKKYNDTYGHQEGDNALKIVSDYLKKHTKRVSDFSFRLGGEEFGILFYGLNRIDSFEFLDKIRDDIEKIAIEHKENRGGVLTVSIGAICLKGADIIDDKTLYKEADDALYQAKENGRNRVVIV